MEEPVLSKKHALTLKTRSKILLLGLDDKEYFGDCIRTLKKYHGNDFSVLAVGTNDDSINTEHLSGDIKIYTQVDLPVLFCDRSFLSFLENSPGIIINPKSYIKNKEYYKAFLNYEHPNTIESFLPLIESEKLKEHLASGRPKETLEKYISKIQDQSQKRSSLDYFLMAYNALN